jgi:hypothetical protein
MRLMIGLPWYMGPDDNTFPLYFDVMSYFGALRERSIWRDQVGKEEFDKIKLPPLDENPGKDGSAEPTDKDWMKLGRFELMITNFSRTSLVGQAREMVVDTALDWEADYLFWWDSDMRFDHSAFLRLLRRNKPVVGGLAFTARHPIHPVMYRVIKKWDEVNGQEMVEGSDIVIDYPRDQLVGDDVVGGKLAMGTALTLYNMNVFKEIPKPWFSSTGCGEDFFFSCRCHEHNIPIFIDTAVKTQHKEHACRWADEESYWKEREIARDSYVHIFGEGVNRVKDGEVVNCVVDIKNDETDTDWSRVPLGIGVNS